MYVMFPNYRPKFKEKSKLYKYFKNVLKDRNDIEKTIENIENILDQIKTDVKDEIDVEGFAEELLNLDISDIKSFEADTESYYKDLFVEAILNAESSPLVDYIKEQASLNEVSSLEYVDSNLPSRKGYQNKIIELYKGLILHPSNIGKIMTPLDHDFIKMDAQNLAPAKEKGDIDNFEFIQDILTKYSFLAGLTGVGQEANASSDYAMGTMSEIYYENVTLLDRGHKGKTLSLEITNKDGEVRFIDVEHTKFDEIDSVPLKDEEIKQWVDSYNSRVNEKDKKSFEEIKKLYQRIPISNSITALMNAFVDIAKDPYITNINWNTLTTNTGNMLIRGGVHPFIVTSFLAQPIITEYVDFVASYETENKSNQKLQSKDAFRVFKISEKFKNDLITVGQFEDGSIATINTAAFYKIVAEREFDLNNLSAKSFIRKNILTEIVKQLGLPNIQSITEDDIENIQKQVKDIVKTHEIYFKESESFTDFTINKSLKEIRENVFKTTDNFQANVFNTFLKFQGYAKKVSAGVMASKFGIKGYGKNSVALLASINKLEDVRSKGVMFYNTKFFYPDGTPKMLQHFKTYHLDVSQKIMQNNPLLFVSSTPFVWNTYNLISKDIYGTKMEDDESNGLGDNLEKSFYTYLLSGFEPFNLTNEEKTNLIKNFYSEFVNTKNKLANEKYYILEQLQVRTKGEHKYIGITNKTNSKEYTDKMINSWRELLKYHPEFGKKLVQYSFLTSGFNPHTTSFYQFIPPSFFFQNNFNQYIKNYTGRYENDNVDLNFVDHFYLANLNNSKFVKFIHPNNVNVEATKKYGLGIKVLPNSISYRYINMDKTFYKNIGVDVNGNNLYSPYVKVKDGYAKIKPIVSEIDLGYKVFNFNSDVVDLPNGVSKEAIEYFNAIEDSVNPNTFVKLVEDMEGDVIEVENNVEVNKNYTETETTSTTSEYEDLGFGQKSNLSEKNIFTVEPIQSADKKAKSKAKIATQYIGFAEGIEGSSTALYAKQIEEQNNRPNTLKEYADKTSATFVNTREVLRKDDIEYYNNRVDDLIQGRLQYAIFAIEDLNNRQYLPFINKLKENGFKNVEGMEWVLSKDGKNPKTEYEKLSNNNIVNSGNYSSNDVIFVSIVGKRGNEAIRKAQQDRTIREAIKALEAGATLITDNAAYVESSSYNEGEKRLAANLKAKGYVYSETIVDGNVLGVWNKNTNQPTPQQEQQSQQNRQLDLFKDGIDPFNEAPNENEQNNCK